MFSNQENKFNNEIIDKIIINNNLDNIKKTSLTTLTLDIETPYNKINELLIFAKLDDEYRDIRFGFNQDNPANIYVIKIFNEEDDTAVYSISNPENCIHNLTANKQIYKPKICTASEVIKGHGKVTREFIIYPYVPGVCLDKFSANLKGKINACEAIISIAYKIAEVGAFIESYNENLPNTYRSLPKIWDIRDSNIIVQKDNVVFIDYCTMKISPYHSFANMILSCLQQTVGIDPFLYTVKSFEEQYHDVFEAENFKDHVSLLVKEGLLSILKNLHENKLNFKDSVSQFENLSSSLLKKLYF